MAWNTTIYIAFGYTIYPYGIQIIDIYLFKKQRYKNLQPPSTQILYGLHMKVNHD